MCSSSSSLPNRALESRVSAIGMQQHLTEKVLKMTIELKLRLLFLNKMDLRIDGIPPKEILQDEEQMKDISYPLQKFEQSKEDLGEGHNKKKTICTPRKQPKIFMTRVRSNLWNHVKRRKPFNVKSVVDTSLKEWSDAIADFQFGRHRKISTKSRVDSENCVNRNGMYSFIQEG